MILETLEGESYLDVWWRSVDNVMPVDATVIVSTAPISVQCTTTPITVTVQTQLTPVTHTFKNTVFARSPVPRVAYHAGPRRPPHRPARRTGHRRQPRARRGASARRAARNADAPPGPSQGANAGVAS